MELKDVISNHISILENDLHNIQDSKEKISDVIPSIEIKYEQVEDSLESCISKLKEIKELLEE